MSFENENNYEYIIQQAMNCAGGTSTHQEVNPQNNEMLTARQQQVMRPLPALKRRAYVKIIEQPAPKGLRFRYECESRGTGPLQGVRSTTKKKTFPTIQVVGYKGRAMVVVSCVTKDPPYRPHPLNIMGGEGCDKGVCTLEIPTETMTLSFTSIAIQRVKKNDIEQSLKLREKIRVDPFRTGFDYFNQDIKIDLNAARLCFQVFLEGRTPGKFCVPLTPVVSDPIHNKKSAGLTIVKLSDCVSYVDGGRKDVILLCEKAIKGNIQVRFYENESGWEVLVVPSQIHKQHAICFKTPKYKYVDVEQPVKVYLQLRRPSDGATGEPVPFELLPLEAEPGALKRKRQQVDDPNGILKVLQDYQNSMYSSSSCNPYVDETPGYIYNLPQHNNVGEEVVLNNPGINDMSNSQSPVWNITSNANVVDQGDDILQGFDTCLNSEEVDATLETMVKDSGPLPDIGSLSFSDIMPTY